jgi:acyl-CoA thioester hydrolase
MAFELEIKPRFRDIDSLAHVNNAVYFTYMEQARTEYYMRISKTKRLDEIEFILASARCDFRSPIAWGETVVVRVWPSRIGTSSFTLRYEMRVKEDGRLAAEGESVQVAYDYGTRTSKPISAEFRRGLEAEIAATR